MRRTKAREIALQILFSLETQDQLQSDPGTVHSMVATYIKNFFPNIKEEILDTPFLEKILRLLMVHVAELDSQIEKGSNNWKLQRMTKVDRNILRIGTLELTYFTDVPIKVTIDECIELAKKFGNEESAAFINGILDHISTQVKRRGES